MPAGTGKGTADDLMQPPHLLRRTLGKNLQQGVLATAVAAAAAAARLAQHIKPIAAGRAHTQGSRSSSRCGESGTPPLPPRQWTGAALLGDRLQDSPNRAVTSCAAHPLIGNEVWNPKPLIGNKV